MASATCRQCNWRAYPTLVISLHNNDITNEISAKFEEEEQEEHHIICQHCRQKNKWYDECDDEDNQDVEWYEDVYNRDFYHDDEYCWWYEDDVIQDYDQFHFCNDLTDYFELNEEHCFDIAESYETTVVPTKGKRNSAATAIRAKHTNIARRRPVSGCWLFTPHDD
jgi:hypothetical protein